MSPVLKLPRYEREDLLNPVQASTETAEILPIFSLLNPTEPKVPLEDVKKDDSAQIDLLSYRPDINVMKDMNKLLKIGREEAEKNGH